MTPRLSAQARFFRASQAAAGRASKPCYVLLHGVGLSHRSFSRLARVLSGSGTVVAPDFPGFGVAARRTRPAHPQSVEQYADMVIDFLSDARPGWSVGGPVMLVGHSMGMQSALDVALRRPDLVGGLVFVGPVVDPRRPTLRGEGLRLARDFAFEPLLTSAMALRDYLHCGTRWYVTEAHQMLDYPTHERISGYAGPLLILRGENDPVAPQDWTDALAANVDGATVKSIPGARHNVIHSHPGEVAARIAKFALSLSHRTST